MGITALGPSYARLSTTLLACLVFVSGCTPETASSTSSDDGRRISGLTCSRCLNYPGGYQGRWSGSVINQYPTLGAAERIDMELEAWGSVVELRWVSTRSDGSRVESGEPVYCLDDYNADSTSLKNIALFSSCEIGGRVVQRDKFVRAEYDLMDDTWLVWDYTLLSNHNTAVLTRTGSSRYLFLAPQSPNPYGFERDPAWLMLVHRSQMS